MTPFDDMISGLESFLSDTDAILISLVVKEENLVLDLNRLLQLYATGENDQKQPITPLYTPYTITIKRQKGQPTDRVTLKDTGAFYNSFDIKYSANEFTIFATDPKTRRLVAKYGASIFGLNDYSLQVLIDTIKPKLVEELNKRLLA